MHSLQNELSHGKTLNRKKEVPGFIHDSNARHDQKILMLRAKGGWAWYGLYFACIEVMRESSELEIVTDAADAVAMSLGVSSEDFQTFLNACVSIGLFQISETGYYAPSLNKRIERYSQAVEQRRNAGKSSAQSRSQQNNNKESVSEGLTGVERDEEVRSTNISSSFNDPNKNKNQNTNKNQNKNINQNQNGESSRGGELSHPPPEPDLPPQLLPSPDQKPDYSSASNDFAKVAERALLPQDDPLVSSSSLFMTTGRRPIKKYPEIWLTPSEYADVLRVYVEAGVPPDKISDGPKKVAAKLRTFKAQGKTTDCVSAYNWLVGWAFTEVLEQQKAVTDKKRSETYLNNARAQ